MKKLISYSIILSLMIIRLFQRLINRLWSRSDQETDPVADYFELIQPDNIVGLSAEDRNVAAEMQRCIRCGICDMLCAHTQAMLAAGIFQGPSLIASTHSRHLPDFRYTLSYLEEYEQCGICSRCVDACPTGVPIREIAQSMRRLTPK